MSFTFTRGLGTGEVSRLERFLECVPAILSWTVIVGLLLLTVFQPVIAALLVIAFVFSWLVRMLYSNILLGVSFVRLRAERDTDWMKRLRAMEDLESCERSLTRSLHGKPFYERMSLKSHLREVRALMREPAQPPSWKAIRHLVIIPIAREGREIFEPGIAQMTRSRFPSEHIVVIFAVEGRAGDEVKRNAQAVRRAWRRKFLDFLVVIHPDGVPGEARVKGANATCAAKAGAAWCAKHGVALENVIVSCFDADTVVSPDYFSCLTYQFVACPDRARASFQPIPVYQNNFWEAPAFARILDVGSTFSQLTQSTDPAALVTFSSHSMSFKALVEIGYWPVDLISDDSSIYWKAYVHYHGRYTVVPMLVTVSMDLAQDVSWWKTVSNTYRQRRRWAWGVEGFPIVVMAFLRDHLIPLGARLKQGFRLLQAHVSWATWPFLLTIMTWLPAPFIALGRSHSVVRYSEPRILSTMFNLAIVGFILSAVLSQIFLPRQKGKPHIGKRLLHVLEWLLVPPISIVFGGLPALDAQTRMAFGKRLGFWVTRKARKRKPAARSQA
ncbi:MAG TPA: glycosyltransferase family 2 protein [Spirochaetia bacterium]